MSDNQNNLSWIEQNNFSQTVNQIRGDQEVPILTPRWLNVLESGYINTLDDALDVLEDAQQVNANDILGNNSM
ncbi:hypothetical protein [Desulfallas thermosapovorans]|uniref:Uncharacterized protein n=1 Tax=Desulfallas thermosapovorans DSM 6562 TaxID=1121431 RepID=A0A5S4ZTM5_9FIRM|nr:hypothetical protein [Desulfallas thermosapovorans]TYO96147.1 hypothetical protein LX24_01095 [Desulfallas thermosapovorans DSM 6562]